MKGSPVEVILFFCLNVGCLMSGVQPVPGPSGRAKRRWGNAIEQTNFGTLKMAN